VLTAEVGPQRAPDGTDEYSTLIAAAGLPVVSPVLASDDDGEQQRHVYTLTLPTMSNGTCQQRSLAAADLLPICGGGVVQSSPLNGSVAVDSLSLPPTSKRVHFARPFC